ncbi:MAG TPA: long-chain-fatty-acid--CoA ligase [Bryobacteraceae bacterium]|nr:long-chain-fatty-acid--CoA ligase [Bryobacteraceae bacterium]
MIIPLTPIRCLYRALDLYGWKEGVISGENRFTYQQFAERCERLASGLLVQGVKSGDRVAYLSFNNHQLLEGYFGVPLVKAILMPLNVRLTPAELTGILHHAKPRILFFEQDFAAYVAEFRKGCPSIARFVAIENGCLAGDLTYQEMLSTGRIERPDPFSFDENAIAELFYTSGSTGSPKGVMLSHRTLYLHALAVSGSLEQSDRFVFLHTIPLFHANGWGCPHTTTMSGASHVMVRRFDPVEVFRLIQAERATHMFVVPVMANAMLHCPERGNYDLRSLRDMHIGGAAASPELVARLEKEFRCNVKAGYGLTETCPVATFSRSKAGVEYANEDSRQERLAMAGWPILGTEVRVAGTDDNDVPRDGQTIGEVLIRGDNVMDGYYAEPDSTEAAIRDGWLHTGDMAVWDEHTFIHIVDRQKDIIISGGENISSIEVERAIAAHPAVLECAVVAAPDPQWGEVPAAIVVRKPEQALTSEELLSFLEPRLARFKLPRIIQFFNTALPKTGTGKILKRELREPFWAGKERRVQGIYLQ